MNSVRKILITGAKGFIGKNLVAELRNRNAGDILEYDKENRPEELDAFTKVCDLVFHLAGVNRPQNEKEFEEGNTDFTNILLNCLKINKNKSPIIFSSSTQAILDNPYGKSKLAAEELLTSYSRETRIPVIVYRLQNVFGKWCRPSYNSVVATFCHNIAHGLIIKINDPETTINLVYIDDVISEFITVAEKSFKISGITLKTDIPPIYTISLSHLSSLLHSFQESRSNKSIPNLADSLTSKLYATYLSYLPEGEFDYPLKMNTDNRGSFTEFLRTLDRGQVSINISKPGIIKGNHWHHTKNEKFLVVSGSGIIRFRKISSSEIFEYNVSGEKLEVIDIPPGYTHNIENLGIRDMVTVMWASEAFDADHPDTWYEEV